MPLLTVLIPTYNRKNSLSRTLDSLQKQQRYDFNIVISDNCSNYSIENEVLSLLDDSFRSRITVFHHPFNVGGTDNIIGLISLCKTKWGWMLGDDDFVHEEAIKSILSTINSSPEVGAAWYTLETTPLKEEKIQSMIDLVSIIDSIKENRNGDFIFCSNKVYNIDEIKSYMEIVHRFSYTRIAQCFPFVELLKDHKPILIIRGTPIVKHSGGSPSWDINKTVSGLSTLIDYPTGLSWKKHCEFVKAVMFPPKFVFSCYLRDGQLPWNYKSYLRNLYSGCYKYCYHGFYRLFIMLFCNMGSTKIGYKVLKTLYSYKRK